MQKTFCDVCDKRITSDNDPFDELGNCWIDVRKYGVSIISKLKIRLDNNPNHNIDICKNCVFDAVEQADKRPKTAHRSE